MIEQVNQMSHGGRRPQSARPDGWQCPTQSAAGILDTPQADSGDSWDIEVIDINNTNPAHHRRPSTAAIQQKPWLNPNFVAGARKGQKMSRSNDDSGMGRLMAHTFQREWIENSIRLSQRPRSRRGSSAGPRNRAPVLNAWSSGEGGQLHGDDGFQLPHLD